MKKITYLLLLVFCFSFAQTEDAYQTTLSKISEVYNTKNADALFDLFSLELQSAFPLEKVKNFINENQNNKGNIGDISFLLDDNGTKRYLVEFDEASSVLILGLSLDNKITKLSIEEY